MNSMGQLGTDEVDLGAGVEDEAAVDYAVTWKPVRCPRCGSEKCPPYKWEGEIRYHKCRCGWNFKSIKE